jgi:hypothetical protein
VAVDILNDKLLILFKNLSFYHCESSPTGNGVLGERGYYAYGIYLTLKDVDLSITKVKHLQTNLIYVQFYHNTQDEFYTIAFKKKIYESLEHLQIDLNTWIEDYQH